MIGEEVIAVYGDAGDGEELFEVQKLVRCKECRHWEMRNSPRGWCEVHQGYVSPQYFCADGEREGE